MTACASQLTHRVEKGDCLLLARSMKERAERVNLVLGSPPYEDAREYSELKFCLKGQDWVDWMKERIIAFLAISDLVVMVVEGRTRNYRWSATPALLMADLHRAGVCLRKPPVYRRHGIPGSGGPDWLKNCYELCVCATNGGKVPWSDNTAMGHAPIYGKGGRMNNVTHRGERLFSLQTRRNKDGTRDSGGRRPFPSKANPGNIIDCGANTHLGEIAHLNEAPFPEKLAEFFVRSFCPPGGIVLDPFAGSGTVAAVAHLWGRNSISMEVRDSQVELIHRRIQEARERANASAGVGGEARECAGVGASDSA